MRHLGRRPDFRGISTNAWTGDAGPEVASGPGMRAAVQTRHGPGTRFPPTWLFILGLVIAWWFHQDLPFAIDADTSGAWRLAAGLVAVGFGAGLFWWGLATFARARTGILLQRPASRLVDFGPYRWSRNPQYVGFVAIYVGLALLMNSIWPLLLLPGVVIALEIIVIAREERYLRTVFGPAYEEYCRRVNRWL